MAGRSVLFTRRYPGWFTPSTSTRSFIGLFSTAAKQHNAGGDGHGDDGEDYHSPSVRKVRILEIKARKLEEKIHYLEERYNRALRDWDAMRGGTLKLLEEAKLFGIRCFCRDIVEVADLLEKGSTVEEKDGAQYLANIQGRLEEVFTKYGLEKMTPIGGLYDPHQHVLVCHTPVAGAKPGTIAVVQREGYTMHGRIVRHARVCVALKPHE